MGSVPELTRAVFLICSQENQGGIVLWKNPLTKLSSFHFFYVGFGVAQFSELVF
jgi:hypothetical protein